MESIPQRRSVLVVDRRLATGLGTSKFNSLVERIGQAEHTGPAKHTRLSVH